MLVLAGPGVSANAIAINKDVGAHTKMPLNVRNRVVSPTGIAERTASLVLPPLSVGEMTLRLDGALNYSQNSAHDLRRALEGA